MKNFRIVSIVLVRRGECSVIRRDVNEGGTEGRKGGALGRVCVCVCVCACVCACHPRTDLPPL